MALLVHVDDVMVVGRRSYILDFFILLITKRFEINSNFLDKVGDKITFLKRTYVLVDDGLVVVPGCYIETMLEIFERSHGHVRAQRVPADASLLIEDKSQEPNMVDATLFASPVGIAFYLSQVRVGSAFCVKELASKMSRPTAIACARFKNLLVHTPLCHEIDVPERGIGKVISCNKELVLETFSDSYWDRRSTSAALHLLNGDPVHRSSGTQKVIVLAIAKAELHSLFSAAADSIYITCCFSFLRGLLVKHQILVDNMAAKTLANEKGVGRIEIFVDSRKYRTRRYHIDAGQHKSEYRRPSNETIDCIMDEDSPFALRDCGGRAL